MSRSHWRSSDSRSSSISSRNIISGISSMLGRSVKCVMSITSKFNQFLTKIFIIFLKHFTFMCGKIVLKESLNAGHFRFNLFCVHENAGIGCKGGQSPPPNHTITGFSSSFFRAVFTKRPTEPF